MALIELKSNLANYRSEFTTPSVVSQTVNNLQQPSKPNINKSSNSNLDIDSIPTSYVLRTQFTNSFIDSSIFDRSNNFISRYTGATRFNQNTVNTSKYNIDSNPSKFSLQGIYSPSKFNSNAVVNTSKYNIDTAASKFSLQGIYTPSKFNSNTVVNTSKYNVDTAPSKFSPTTIYTPTSLYPESKVPDTIKRWKGATAPAVNFFDDNKSGATGFNIKFTDPNQTKFIGATATSYTYPKLLGLSDRLVSRPLTNTNSKLPNTGTATLANQLPNGSVFQYAIGSVIVSKKFSTKGYSESSKYGDNVKSIKDQSSKSLLFTRATEENSTSAIDYQYKKFNLRDESHNPNYIRQPFVLRGIQREGKGKQKPQYWGFGSSKPGFDDGLIQGGIVTVADRVKADLDRIGSWMTSPKGLLWIVKQVGLGLTNPRVETAGLLVPRLTRIHTGVASLLSVAGSPFGLHFTRHATPFVNRIADYEFVQRQKKRRFDESPTRSNRLLNLRRELGLELDNDQMPTSRFIFPGMNIRSLSGLGGPNSLYGVGVTDITRSVKSDGSIYKWNSRMRDFENAVFNVYSISNNYAGAKAGQNTATIDNGQVNLLQSFGLDRGNSKTKPGDLKDLAEDLFKNITIFYGPGKIAKDYSRNPYAPNFDIPYDLIASYSDTLYIGSLKPKTGNNFDVNKDTANNTIDDISKRTGLGSKFNTEIYPDPAKSHLPSIAIETNTAKASKYPGSPKNPINDYITMAYGKLEKTSAEFKSKYKGDFRNALDKQTGFTGNANAEYYKGNNLEGKYGFGNLGEVGADRSNPNAFAASGLDFGQSNRTIIVKNNPSFRGDKVNALDVNLNGISSGQIYQGAKDLIKFYFQDGAVQNGSTGNVAVMAFRATMTGFTDSFSPGWDRIDIMGRPDGAYLYNSFERNISFNFTVAALSRSEMIPMWRKLNYLASYTMPDFNGDQKPSGPFMRITIGDLFHQTPGFITSLSYTIPDDATWDIAEDADSNPDAKQLPMVVEASVSFTIVGDYRPQMHGRVYSLSKNGTRKPEPGQWLSDSSVRT
jgi:hypothetical protein